MKPTEHDARNALARGLKRTRQRADRPVAYRRHDLGLVSYVLGMVSILSLCCGFGAAVLGSVAGLPSVTLFGIWLIAGGALGFIVLVLRSNA